VYGVTLIQDTDVEVSNLTTEPSKSMMKRQDYIL